MNRELQATLGWKLTRHARTAATSRGFTVAQVLMAATDPDLRYTSFIYGQGREVRCIGDVCAVVHAPSQTVLTVLWHHAEAWTDSQVREARLAC